MSTTLSSKRTSKKRMITTRALQILIRAAEKNSKMQELMGTLTILTPRKILTRSLSVKRKTRITRTLTTRILVVGHLQMMIRLAKESTR